MRLYHMILVLAALIVSLNMAFQALWLHQFSQVRDSMREFGGNYLPSVRKAGDLTRLVTEFRNLELRYVLAVHERELAGLARQMGRIAARIITAEEHLDGLCQTPEERRDFQGYLAAKASYVAGNRAVLEAMLDGRAVEAAALARGKAADYALMISRLEGIERVNMELGVEANREAGDRFGRMLGSMALAGLATSLLGAGAAVLAARRIGQPIARLARHMVLSDGSPPEDPPPPVPSGVSSEVRVLYEAFGDLSAKLSASMQRLEALAVTDQLTGLPNRRKLLEEGPLALAICRRGGHPCSVAMLDLDHFKAVNDTHGHDAGDAVLSQTAAVLRSVVRDSDVLARVGGEEFALLAPNSGREETLHLAERLRRAVEEHVVTHGPLSLRVTVSIGTATDHHGAGGFDALLRQADQALYRAKESGRNRVVSSEDASSEGTA
ncbi:Response regulator PleD [Fundidesulfovibrio magnetotacticus]|uniref:diguanylate cyclase n=1 Tax=Fundidesulfovibrio magnetotacticus TaxID=2730080 RepID=A0A6V8M2N4_9BACT|nr:diguanylate cyclase [Fundidesulfovibrio magnetotacticus]GFK96077.1 Response regulator PleD [Fundidesulfovibrio magnetotacticus]